MRQPTHAHVIGIEEWKEHCKNLTEQLRLLEWCGSDGEGNERWDTCPICGDVRPIHAEDCELAAVLAIDLWAVSNANAKSVVTPDPDDGRVNAITVKQARLLRAIIQCNKEFGNVPTITVLCDLACVSAGTYRIKSTYGHLTRLRKKSMITGAKNDITTSVVTEFGLAALARHDAGGCGHG